jgi:hypothetical protein
MRFVVINKKRVMGRPPADWVYKLAELNVDEDKLLDYEQIASMLNIKITAISRFCADQKVEGEFFVHTNSSVRKRFKVKNLIKAAQKFVKLYYKEV